MGKIKRPCLTCGQLTDSVTRCRNCAKERDSIYDAEYHKRAAIVRATATVCWICGKGAITGDPWTADHVVPHFKDSELRPAHRSCNSRRGDHA